MDLVQRLSLTIILNLPILIIILRKKLLVWPSGVLAAGIVGVTLFIVHPALWIILLTFFFTSTKLTHFRGERKTVTQKEFAKGGTRDAGQVLANSFGALVFSALQLIFLGFEDEMPLTGFFLAAITYFAAMAADTYATEIGILSKYSPRLITNPRKSVPVGTSGGVTIDGMLAGLAGSTVMAIATFVCAIIFSANELILDEILLKVAFCIIITISGFFGMLLDSFLGATIQAMNYCPKCEKFTEALLHVACGGTPTVFRRGIQWFSNDWVNLSSGMIVASISFVVWTFLTQ